MKKLFTITLCILAVAALVACKNSSRKAAEGEEAESTEEVMEIIDFEIPEEPIFDIVTTMGTIRVKLYEGTPAHRDNFVKLVRSGFYNGVLFHRVINGFMIQTGDPLSKDPSQADLFGTGGPGYTIPAEFKAEYRHKKGALAAARRGDAANPLKESSGSQFYIVQDEANCASLDGEYTVFGETVSGLDVIDRIAAVQTDRRDRPVSPVKISRIRLVNESRQ